RRALEIDPYLGAAVNAYFQNDWVRKNEEDKQKEIAALFTRMNDAGLYNATKARHSELGHYGAPIRWPDTPPAEPKEPPPVFLPADKLEVVLAPGTRWAKRSDFGTGDAAKLIERIRKRFGGTLTLLDYNRDGKLDVLLLGAVVRDGKVGNLLLENKGDGRF